MTALHGLLVIDKPGGMTSHDVVQAVRRAAHERQVGHGGTLDPLATGVLPVLLGVATRLARFLPADPKVYQVTARFGVETTTGDIDGTPLAPPREVTFHDDALQAALTALTGAINQVPPMFSAKKVEGRRLYQHARAGVEIERAAVPVVIHAIRLLGRSGLDLDLEIHCSPGTYVRSLVVDLGRLLGTAATVAALRRTRSGAFDLTQALSLEDLAAPDRLSAQVVSVDRLPLALGQVTIADGDAQAFAAGRTCPAPESAEIGHVAVRSSRGSLLGVAEVQSLSTGNRLQPRVVLVSQS